MKLSELIAFRNRLNRLSTPAVRDTAVHELDHFTHLIDTGGDLTAVLSQELKSQHANVIDSFNQFDQTVDQVKKLLHDQITEQEKYWFSESYRLYDKEMRNDPVEYTLNRRVDLSEELLTVFKTRLNQYSDWRYPGMIIRPAKEQFMQELIMQDPLYLVDLDYNLLKPAMENYSETYQRRLRPYVISEIQDEPLLTKIPDSQFGICLAYNFFNFRPLEVIKQYMTEIYTKLCPGGVLIMTFNDCDNEKAVDLVERHFSCYTPGYLIKDLATNIGYSEVFSYNGDQPSTWIELRKPGELSSLRGGQTLARIVNKEPKPIDTAT